MPEDERILINTDAELDGRRRVDDYRIQRIAKYAILLLSLCVALVVVAIVLVAIITNKFWQDYAIKAVFQGLPGIFAVVLVVLGLKNTSK